MKKSLNAIFVIAATILSISFSSAQASTTNDNSIDQEYSISNASLETRLNNYVQLAVGMRDYVTPKEYAALYIPIKKFSSIAKINLRTYGALSQRTHISIMNLVNFVNNHQNDFDSLWEVEAFFDDAQDLMAFTMSLTKDLE